MPHPPRPNPFPPPMNKLKIPQTLSREATLSNEGERGFSMSISSEEAQVLRYDWANDREYYEVLDHSPEGMDRSRLDKGLPILWNHDRDQHLGRARAYDVSNGKCNLRDLIWSESEFAQGKKRDAESGALPVYQRRIA